MRNRVSLQDLKAVKKRLEFDGPSRFVSISGVDRGRTLADRDKVTSGRDLQKAS